LPYNFSSSFRFSTDRIMRSARSVRETENHPAGDDSTTVAVYCTLENAGVFDCEYLMNKIKAKFSIMEIYSDTKETTNQCPIVVFYSYTYKIISIVLAKSDHVCSKFLSFVHTACVSTLASQNPI
jgi:hypothetical protein